MSKNKLFQTTELMEFTKGSLGDNKNYKQYYIVEYSNNNKPPFNENSLVHHFTAYESHPSRIRWSILKCMVLIVILSLVLLLLYEISQHCKRVEHENIIDKNYCVNLINENDCENISEHDSEALRLECMRLNDCINHDLTVFEYLKRIFKKLTTNNRKTINEKQQEGKSNEDEYIKSILSSGKTDAFYSIDNILDSIKYSLFALVNVIYFVLMIVVIVLIVKLLK